MFLYNLKFLFKVASFFYLLQSCLPHEESVVFVVSTTGQGDSPDSFKVRCQVFTTNNAVFSLLSTLLFVPCIVFFLLNH